MFKNLFKKSKPLKLGRWGVTYEAPVLEKRINWANHDHCGSEVCENHFVKNKKENKEVESWTKRLKEKKQNQDNKETSTNKISNTTNYTFDPLIPFCI
jgi:hypothetical protein